MSSEHLIEDGMETAIEDFEKKFKEVYGEADIVEMAPRIFADPSNLAGEGASKRVFNIPGMEDYLLAFLKEEYNSNERAKPFKPCDIPLPKYNFGQIMFEGNGMLVMKKTKGVPHSLKCWFSHLMKMMEGKQPVSKVEAELALLKMCEISRMPIDSFVHFASQVKYLNENSLPMDTVNPNNLLIDYENKRINMIDVFDGPLFLRQIKSPMNGVRNMEAVLLDSVLHTEYLKVLPPVKQELMKCASRVVICKCQRAAKSIGLVNDSNNVRHYFELFIQNSGDDKERAQGGLELLRHYLDFTKLYRDELSREQLDKGKKVPQSEDSLARFLALKEKTLKEELGDKVGETADRVTGEIREEHRLRAQKQMSILMKLRAERSQHK